MVAIISIGELIKLNRIKLKLSQKELADILNFSISTISRWETNFCLPDYRSIKILAEFFKFSKEELIDIMENPFNIQYTVTFRSVLLHCIKKEEVIKIILILLMIVGIVSKIFLSNGTEDSFIKHTTQCIMSVFSICFHLFFSCLLIFDKLKYKVFKKSILRLEKLTAEIKKRDNNEQNNIIKTNNLLRKSLFKLLDSMIIIIVILNFIMICMFL